MPHLIVIFVFAVLPMVVVTIIFRSLVKRLGREGASIVQRATRIALIAGYVALLAFVLYLIGLVIYYITDPQASFVLAALPINGPIIFSTVFGFAWVFSLLFLAIREKRKNNENGTTVIKKWHIVVPSLLLAVTLLAITSVSYSLYLQNKIDITTDSEALEKFHNSLWARYDIWVQASIANNSNTPTHILTALIESDKCTIWERGSHNPKMPSELLTVMSEGCHNNPYLVPYGVYTNPNTSVETLWNLAKTGGYELGAIASNPNSTPELLEELSRGDLLWTGLELAKNIKSTPFVFNQLAQNGSWHIKITAIENPSITDEALLILSQDGEESVRKNAAKALESRGISPPDFQAEGVDLIVTSLSHSPFSDINTATPITFTAVVKNQGNRAAPPSILEFKIPLWQSTKHAIPALEPGQTHEIVRNAVLNYAQNYVITAIADQKEQVEESNETNNTKVDRFTVVEK